MYETNIVANASQMAAITQQVKDHYYQLMKRQADEMSDGYAALDETLDTLVGQLAAYPKVWNQGLYNEINQLKSLCKQNVVSIITLNGYSTKCAKTGMQLRDMVYQTNQLSAHQIKVSVMETEIVTADPTPKPTPVPTPKPGPTPPPAPKPQPQVRNMKQKMPFGKLSIAEYKKWLQQQLTMLNSFGSTDSLDFDN